MGFVYRASLERENWNSIQFQRFGKESWCDKIMRQSGLIVCCLFISLLVLSNSFAFGKKPSSKDLPWAQAEILILSQHPYWLRLLHYPSHSPMVGLWRSEIQNPLFLSWSGWQCKSGCRTKEDTGSAVFSSRKYSDFNVWLRLFHIGNINRCLTLFLQVN